LEEFYCNEHKEYILECLCIDCEIIICKICSLSEHKSHLKSELKESKEKIKEINNNIKKKINNNRENIEKKLLSINANELEILKNIKNFELKIKEENNNLEKNNYKKKEVLFEYQKLLNFNSIAEEKPIQYLLNSNNFIKKFNKNEKIYKNILNFGCNSSGQLGLGSIDIKNILTPTKVNFDHLNIKKIICSENSTFMLSSKFLINYLVEGLVYSFGFNEYGNLGLGDTTDRYEPTEITFFKNLEIENIYCGFNHCIAKSSNIYFKILKMENYILLD
jgi:alpha-tubulin suppressor-like RCC1 family protein